MSSCSGLGSQLLLWAVPRHFENRETNSTAVSMDVLSEELMMGVICTPLFVMRSEPEPENGPQIPWCGSQSGSHSPATDKGKGTLALELGRSGPKLLTRVQQIKERLFPGKHGVLSAPSSYTLQGSVPELGRGWSGLNLKSIKTAGFLLWLCWVGLQSTERIAA